MDSQIISPSLLRPLLFDREYEYNPNFDTGMGDLICDSDDEMCDKEDEPTSARESSEGITEPSTKHQRLSLKLSKKKAPLSEAANRFAVPVDEQTLQ